MGSGSFPIDLLLFGMIAAFLVLRLRSILGRRTGFERSRAERGPVQVPGMGRPVGPVVDGTMEPAAPARPVPDPASPVGAVLVRMRQVDRNFDPARFLSGAEAAFRMIVAAFAAGDRVALRPLLSDETYRSFEQAIATREANGETQRSEIRAINQASIEQASLAGTIGSITVKFVSDQVAETLDRNGTPVAGTDAVTEITDVWSFERDLAQPDPAWRLTAARSG
ncbi:MAG TPA: Tim44/TimA family putative adaptor protein [Acetobacteraceae bacterium]|nr:Tim44/TimA family putative adaptor protein [Acetobacteraceae bacterium]